MGDEVGRHHTCWPKVITQSTCQQRADVFSMSFCRPCRRVAAYVGQSLANYGPARSVNKKYVGPTSTTGRVNADNFFHRCLPMCCLCYADMLLTICQQKTDDTRQATVCMTSAAIYTTPARQWAYIWIWYCQHHTDIDSAKVCRLIAAVLPMSSQFWQ